MTHCLFKDSSTKLKDMVSKDTLVWSLELRDLLKNRFFFSKYYVAIWNKADILCWVFKVSLKA